MNHVKLQKHLPYSPQDIYDLVMDINQYPLIYPMVKSARVIATSPTHQDVEMHFNLPPMAGIQNAVQISRVTGTPHSVIQATTVKGPLKALDLRWDMTPHPQGGTQLTAHMAYETGKGFLVDAFLKGIVQGLVNDTMSRFEAHAAQVLTPVAANQNQAPHSSPGQKTGQKSGGPSNGTP